MPSAWMIWQLVDSAFPSGGFAHSGGLEAAWQHGYVSRGEGLRDFIRSSLWQTVYGSIPFVLAAFDAPDCFCGVDERAEATLTNHVANRASRAQGRALLMTAQRIFPLLPSLPENRMGMSQIETRPCHLAPAFGWLTSVLKLTRSESAQAFLFQSVRGLVSGAVRLSVVGPLEGQRIQASLAPDLDLAANVAEGLTVEDVAQTAPLQDLYQSTQDRLYSRLFQS